MEVWDFSLPYNTEMSICSLQVYKGSQLQGFTTEKEWIKASLWLSLLCPMIWDGQLLRDCIPQTGSFVEVSLPATIINQKQWKNENQFHPQNKLWNVWKSGVAFKGFDLQVLHLCIWLTSKTELVKQKAGLTN